MEPLKASGTGSDGQASPPTSADASASSVLRMGDSELHQFFQSWSWKREHLPDRQRFRRPYAYAFDDPALRGLSLKQAQFKATGFASTVWDSSIVTSKYLEKQAGVLVRGKRCLDLSAGCGLVAAVLARLGAAEVLATDLQSNLALLRDNCEANVPGGITVKQHCWGERLDELLPQFDLVVACDVMYIAEAVPALVATLAAACAPAGLVLLAHGRNRGGEQAFMKEVRGTFDVEELGSGQLHDMYRCSDVAVYCLSRTPPDGASRAPGRPKAGAGAPSAGQREARASEMEDAEALHARQQTLSQANARPSAGRASHDATAGVEAPAQASHAQGGRRVAGKRRREGHEGARGER